MRTNKRKLKKLLTEAKQMDAIAARAMALATRARKMASNFRSIAQKLQTTTVSRIKAGASAARGRWFPRRFRRSPRV